MQLSDFPFHTVILSRTFRRITKLFSPVAAPRAFPPTVHKCSIFSTSLSASVTSRFFGCEAVSHCDFFVCFAYFSFGFFSLLATSGPRCVMQSLHGVCGSGLPAHRLSGCGVWAPEHAASVAVVPGLSHCGA